MNEDLVSAYHTFRAAYGRAYLEFLTVAISAGTHFNTDNIFDFMCFALNDKIRQKLRNDAELVEAIAMFIRKTEHMMNKTMLLKNMKPKNSNA